MKLYEVDKKVDNPHGLALVKEGKSSLLDNHSRWRGSTPRTARTLLTYFETQHRHARDVPLQDYLEAPGD
jgi:hypothetical protein